MKTKISLISLAALGTLTTPLQATQVDVYGMVDAYVQYYNKGGTSAVDLGSGGKGGSRIGIKGTEDLGAGNSVFFRLENGFMTDDGTNSPGGSATAKQGWAFQRESVLGVKTNYGTLSFGRQYTLNFGNIAMFDAFGLSLGSTINNFMSPVNDMHLQGVNGQLGANNATRVNNSFLYSTPVFGGFQLNGMVSLGQQDDSNHKGNTYSVQAVYRAGAFATGFSWFRQNVITSADLVYKNSTNNNTYNLGASYDFGFTKLYGNFVYKHAGAKSQTNPSLYVIGGSLKTPLCGGYLLNGFHWLKNDTYHGANAFDVSARYDYPLSKRTTIYGGGVYLHNSKNANYNINGGGGSTPAPSIREEVTGDNVWTLFVGLNHTF